MTRHDDDPAGSRPRLPWEPDGEDRPARKEPFPWEAEQGPAPPNPFVTEWSRDVWTEGAAPAASESEKASEPEKEPGLGKASGLGNRPAPRTSPWARGGGNPWLDRPSAEPAGEPSGTARSSTKGGRGRSRSAGGRDASAGRSARPRRPTPRKAPGGAEPGTSAWGTETGEPSEATGFVGAAGPEPAGGGEATWSPGGAGPGFPGAAEPGAPGRRAGGDGGHGGGVPGEPVGRPGEEAAARRKGRRKAAERSRPGRTPEEALGKAAGTATGNSPEKDPEKWAREICLRALERGPRTRAQLADALRRKGVPDEVAEGVLGRFTEVGLIDDEAFAQAWVQSRHAGRGLARRALAAELRRRGVAPETVDEAVETLDPEQEERTARRLIARKVAATRGVEPGRRMRRLVGVLARKGYPPGLAYRVVREALEEDGADVEDLPEGEPE